MSLFYRVTEQAVNEVEKGQNLDAEKPTGEGDAEATGHKEAPTSEVEEKPEDKVTDWQIASDYSDWIICSSS